MFLLPFTASAMASLYPSAITRYVREHRRYLGIAFALAMFVHITCVMWLFRVSVEWPAGLPVFVLGGAAYVLIAALFLTSFDRTTDWLGARRWRRLHVTGIWYIWTVFVLVMLLSLEYAPLVYGPLIAAALIAAGLRWARRRRMSALRSPVAPAATGITGA